MDIPFSQVEEFLKPLNCVVHQLKPGQSPPGYNDSWGEYVQPQIIHFTVSSVKGDRRQADSALLAKITEHKQTDTTSIYVGSAEEQGVIRMDLGEPMPEVHIDYYLAFGYNAVDAERVAPYIDAVEHGTHVNFGVVLDAIKRGYRAQRAGWNGQGMFIYLVPSSVFEANRAPLLGIFEAGTVVKYGAHIDLVTAIGDCVTWTISQTDALAKDWIILPRAAGAAQ